MPADPAQPVAYQLRAWLRGISPMIWRRLLVRSDSTIEDLHYTLQLAFGWNDDHLNRFRIHGKELGVHHSGGISFGSNPAQIRLADFGFRPREYFFYDYNLNIPWRHEVRVEQILPLSPRRRYPVCIGGARAVPPEDCHGPRVYVDIRASLWLVSIYGQRRRLWDERRGDPDDRDDDELEDARPRPWLNPDRFDRHEVNEKLQQYVRDEREWLFS